MRQHFQECQETYGSYTPRAVRSFPTFDYFWHLWYTDKNPWDERNVTLWDINEKDGTAAWPTSKFAKPVKQWCGTPTILWAFVLGMPMATWIVPSARATCATMRNTPLTHPNHPRWWRQRQPWHRFPAISPTCIAPVADANSATATSSALPAAANATNVNKENGHLPVSVFFFCCYGRWWWWT